MDKFTTTFEAASSAALSALARPPGLFCSLLWCLFLVNACHGQVAPHSQEEATTTPERSTNVTGTPPPSVAHPDPLHDPSLVSQYIRSIFQDTRGDFWFGPAGQSVARYDGETLHYYSRSEFFRGNDRVEDTWNSVHAIAEDRRGNIWFGTDCGVVRYDGRTFRSYTEKEGLSDTRVGRKSILVDRSGEIWVGTRAGVFRYIPSADHIGGQCFAPFPLLPPVNCKGIMEDRSGNIWFATQDRGVFRYDGAAVTQLTGPAGLGDNYAGGMAQDEEGNFWFTIEGGICRYDGNTFTDYTTEDGIGGSEVWGLLIEQSGIIWITARGSTTRFDPSVPITHPEAFTVYTAEDGLNCCVQSMYQDRSGNMWWGTGQGLYRFDGERFYQVKQQGPW